MTDVVDKVTRSRMMSGIRGKNTKNEVLIRKALFARGYRYRINDSRLPGKPDLVFPKYSAVIFIHGCFWHGHECDFFRMPASNTEFWKKKIGGNRERDKKNIKALLEKGWRVATVWECSLRGKERYSLDKVSGVLAEWLKGKDEVLEMKR